MPAPPAFPSPPDDATRLDLSAAARRAVAAAKGALPEQSRQELGKEFYKACEAELAARPDVHRAARLHYEMARLCEGPLEDLEGAGRHYELAHQIAKEHLPTLRGARRALVVAGKGQKALPYFDAEIRLTSDPARRAMLSYEKGLLLEDTLAQHREARAAFAAALELDETNPTILKALERTQRQVAAWDDLAKTYERAANSVSSDPKHRAALIAERARLAEARKKQPEAAIELYESALALDPTAPGVVPALKSLLYTHGRWRDLVSVLAHAADQAGDAESRALLRYGIARLHADRLGNLDEAIAALELAAKDMADDPLILEELGRTYEVAKRWDRLVEVLARLTQRVHQPAERVVLFHRIGQVAEERLGDQDAAIEWYQKALEVDAGFLPAVQAIAKLRRQRQEWTALISVHLGEAGATHDNTRRAAAHARVAHILETHLGKAEQAIEHHAKALGLVAGYPPSFKALSRLYTEAGRFRELSELYERAIDLAKDEETKIAYLFKVGRLQEDALGSPQAALAAYRRILDLAPKHLGAMHALQRAAERARQWQALIDGLDYEAEHTADRVEKVALLHRAGEVAEDHLGDSEKALERYRKIVEMDPAYLPALSSLGRAYYRAGRWDDLLGVYRLELTKTPRGSESSALLFKMGEIAEERAGKEEEALRCYRQATEADASNGLARRALMRLLTTRGDHAEVVRLSAAEIPLLKSPDEIARAALRVAEIYEHRVSQPEKALEMYGRAIEAVADFRPALDGRARLLEQRRDYKALAETLAKEAETAKDPQAAMTAKYREGEIWRDMLDQPKRALDAFEAVLARDPNHLGALLALEPLYAATESWEKLAQNFAAQARILQNGFARAAALREQARVEESKGLRTPQEIVEGYLAVVRTSPGDFGALGVLERLGLASKDWQLLAHVDAKLSALPDEPTIVAAHETRLAESLEASGDPSALETYRSALVRDPENMAAARGFSRLAQRAGSPELLSEAAAYEARVLRDLERAASLLVESAHLRANQSDPLGASGDLERALDLHPDHVESAEALEELLTATGEIKRLVDALSRAAGAAKARERRADLWVRVGALRAEREGDVGAGLGALARALKEVPKHLPALMKQAELHSKNAQHKEAAEALEQVIVTAPDGPMRTVARVALARLLHDELGETDRALSSLQRVLDVDPSHRGAIGLMLEVRVARGEGDDATALAQKLVDEARNETERAASLRQLAALERKRGRRAKAADALGRAMAISGAEVLDDFLALLGEQKKAGEKGSHRAFADAVAQYLKSDNVTASAAEQSRLQGELGRVLCDELGQPDRGIVAFRRALELSKNDMRLRDELANRLMQAGHGSEAAQELRALLEIDPLRVETWQRLVEAFRGAGMKALADAAVEPLVALGGGSDLDRVNLQTRVRRSVIPDGAFDAAMLRALGVMRPEDEQTSALLAAVAPLLSKIYPAELEAYGVTVRDRIGARSGNPLRTLADRIGRSFGVFEFELYVHKAHQGGVEVEFSDETAIMVPAHVTKLGEAEQTFLLARVLCNISRGLHAVDKLPISEVGALLAAATRTVEPNFGAGTSDEERIAALARRVQKAMPWLGRRPVEDAARAYAPAAKPRPEDWHARVRMTAARAGWLAADDMGATVNLMRRLEGDQSHADAAARQRATIVLGDVLRFCVSDAAGGVRKRLGLG